MSNGVSSLVPRPLRGGRGPGDEAMVYPASLTKVNTRGNLAWSFDSISPP